MELISINAERKAQLDDYALRHGQNAVEALDEALRTYLEWEHLEYQDSVEGIRRGYEDVKAGRTRPAAEFLACMGEKLRALRPERT